MILIPEEKKNLNELMSKFQERLQKYGKISTTLAVLSNEKLKQMVTEGKPMHEGIGGKSSLVFIDDIPVFAKKIPLTDLEQFPFHVSSTAKPV